MKNDIFELLCNYMSYSRFDEFVVNNKEFSDIKEEILRLQNELAEIGLTEAQKTAVQNLLKTNGELNEYGVEVVYKQAFLDCVALLQEIGVLNHIPHKPDSTPEAKEQEQLAE